MSIASFAAAKSQIRTMFDVAFVPIYPTSEIDIVHDNLTYNPTTVVIANKTINKPYVEVKVTTSDSLLISHGRPGFRRFRMLGLILCRIYTNSGDGDGYNTTICDVVASIFRGKLIDGLITDEPKLDLVGSSNGFYRQDVITPYRFTIIA